MKAEVIVSKIDFATQVEFSSGVKMVLDSCEECPDCKWRPFDVVIVHGQPGQSLNSAESLVLSTMEDLDRKVLTMDLDVFCAPDNGDFVMDVQSALDHFNNVRKRGADVLLLKTHAGNLDYFASHVIRLTRVYTFVSSGAAEVTRGIEEGRSKGQALYTDPWFSCIIDKRFNYSALERLVHLRNFSMFKKMDDLLSVRGSHIHLSMVSKPEHETDCPL
jgi:hypothetical protein